MSRTRTATSTGACRTRRFNAFVNDLERPIGTYLYGRRMYEVMRFWETAHNLADQPAFVLDYAAVWQAADKIVYSRTLDAVSTARTRMNREFDPDAVRRLKQDTDQDLSVSGPDLAAHAIRAGLVDEYRQFLGPVVVGGGQRWLPDDARIDLGCSRSIDSATVLCICAIART